MRLRRPASAAVILGTSARGPLSMAIQGATADLQLVDPASSRGLFALRRLDLGGVLPVHSQVDASSGEGIYAQVLAQLDPLGRLAVSLGLGGEIGIEGDESRALYGGLGLTF